MGAEHYSIDPDVSRFVVRVSAGGMLSAFGHNPTIAIRDFSGEATFDPEALDGAELHLRVKSGSLSVTDNVSEKDRREIERTMNQEVLETAKYPEIVFDSANVSASKAGDGQYWVNLVGNLSLHGITSTQPVAAQIALIGDTLRAYGEFALRQTTYGIKPVTVAGGTLKVKDELKCSFDILARKQANHT
jgi:polyisoprenoid-binding protein YceI